jgi:hypothetical protein
LFLLVLPCVSILSPLNPVAKVVNLFPSTLMKAMEGVMLNSMSQHYMALFIRAMSTLSFIYVEYQLGKPHTVCMFWGAHKSSLCQEPEFLASQPLPLSPTSTIPSASGIEYTYPYIITHIKNGIPQQQRKIKTFYTKINTL